MLFGIQSERYVGVGGIDAAYVCELYGKHLSDFAANAPEILDGADALNFMWWVDPLLGLHGLEVHAASHGIDLYALLETKCIIVHEEHALKFVETQMTALADRLRKKNATILHFISEATNEIHVHPLIGIEMEFRGVNGVTAFHSVLDEIANAPWQLHPVDVDVFVVPYSVAKRRGVHVRYRIWDGYIDGTTLYRNNLDAFTAFFTAYATARGATDHVEIDGTTVWMHPMLVCEFITHLNGELVTLVRGIEPLRNVITID